MVGSFGGMVSSFGGMVSPFGGMVSGFGGMERRGGGMVSGLGERDSCRERPGRPPGASVPLPGRSVLLPGPSVLLPGGFALLFKPAVLLANDLPYNPPMLPDLLGWISSLILLATITTQIVRQWEAHTSKGVSRWLFIGQLAASAGFTLYSILLHNTVFIVTNALMLASAVVGLLLLLHHRRHESSL